MLVYEQLPDSNPLKKSAAEYINKYEAKYGKGSRTTFGGHAWDAYMLLSVAIPEALKKAQPGTQGVPPRACATRSRTCTSWWPRTACSRCRRPTTTASTTARGR